MCNEVARSRLRTGVMIDGEQLEEVTEYKYLGRLLTSGNDISKEIVQIIQSGWRRFGEYSHILKGREIPICLKRKIIDTVMLPAMTYGAETWALTIYQEKKLAVAQRSMARLLSNITKRDKIRNEIIRSKTVPGERYNRESAVHERTEERTCSQNEQHQVGQGNIRMDTQRRKLSRRETQKETERQLRGSW